MEKPGATGDPADREDLLHRHVWKGIRVYHILLASAFFILIGLGIFLIIGQNVTTTRTAIAAYQDTELEIVRGAARSIREYVYEQTVVLNRTDIQEIEQEVYQKFVDPIQLLDNGDAWIYAPDHVVFDKSSDFPDIYRGKSMAEIFEVQKHAGASHYEEMTAAVTSSREGTGYYIWLPEKGEEIAAWTPVTIGNYTWTIGLSTPLPEILEATGAASRERGSFWISFCGILIAMFLFFAWLRADIQRSRSREALRKTNEKLRLLSSITRHDINNQLTVLRAFLDRSAREIQDPKIGGYIRRAQQAAASIEGHIRFTKVYQEIGVHSPAWQDVRECVGKSIAAMVPETISGGIDLDRVLIYADPLFEKVIQTLIDNTLRHAGTATMIRFSHRFTPAQELVLIYEDNGNGIGTEDKERIFEQGYGRNTGFGLFLAREILGITGLSIQETGEPGKGARFEITVPKGAYRSG